MIVTEFDPIALPADTARAEEPIRIIQRDHPAWPDAEFEIRLDWNHAGEFFAWSVGLDGHGRIIERQPAEYASRYQYQDYILFMFIDISGKAESVTPETLGSTVDLVAFPGLHSPGYADWLARQRVDDDDERETLLNEWNRNVIQ